jgi:hypothetical protein
MAKSLSLADRVLARSREAGKKPKGFMARLDAKQAADLLDIRRRFQAGEYAGQSVTGLARAIVEECQQDGIPVCGIQGMSVWLKERD